jgi:dipeptidyl aminopeptidase/acylaminoacyl peptidase
MILGRTASVIPVRPSAHSGPRVWLSKGRNCKIRRDGGHHRVSLLRSARSLWVLAWTALAAAGSQASPPPPSVEVFGALPAQTQPVLSSDAHWIAWMEKTERNPHIVIFDLNARRIARIAALPERTALRSLQWSDGETLLATLRATLEAQAAARPVQAYFLTIALTPTGEGALILPSSNARAMGAYTAMSTRMIRARTTKPHTVIMSSGDGLLEVDSSSGKSKTIKTGNVHTVDWAVDRDGKPMAREDWDWRTSAYHVYALNGDFVKTILSKDDSSAPVLAGLLPDDSGIVLLASNGHAHQAAWMVPLDGSPQKLLMEDPNADLTGAFTDAYTGAIIGFYASGTKTSVQWLDPVAQRRQDVLQRSFPNQQVDVYGWSIDGDKTLARVQSPSSPPIYYLIDFKSRRADIAAEEYPALAGVKLGEFKEITYKARDGTDIPAYLTLPPESVSGVHPLVVLPHGDPNGRDYPSFNWIVQFLASRGYAVLQPQFRGSSGFGEAFERAGYRQWGGLMQDDVTDGVRAMIDQQIADPKRVCILGFAYGGYAALAGAAFTPDLYRCAISVNGVSDLRSLFNDTVPQSSSRVTIRSAAMSHWSERVSAPNDSALDKKSPIHSVAQIKVPILLVYGNSGGAASNSQSLKMEAALRSAGKEVTLVELADEGQWLSRTETRVKLLSSLESFLYDNLQNAQP